MKKFYITLFALICIICCLCLSACGDGGNSGGTLTPGGDTDTKPSDPQPPAEPNGEALVVYFSYSGTTERVAEEIAKQLGTEATEIVPAVPYTAEDTNYGNANSRNRRELADDLRPEISDETYNAINMNEYGTVVIGYPIWNGYEPMIIRTFIEHYGDLNGKTVYTFSTSSSSLGDAAHNGIKNRYSDADVKENLHLTASAMPDMQKRVTEWIARNNLKTENLMENNTLNIKAGGAVFSATLADNSSARALKELLAASPLTVNMSDYGGFEKVGNIGATLPRNDEYITTEAGDLILYSGNRFVIYYGTNTYSLTRLGKIDNATQAELIAALGSGDVTVELSLKV